MEIAKDDNTLVARPYQDQLIRTCLEKNSIVYLPTGAGKTFIPLMVFRKMGRDYERPLNDGGRRSVFLVNTRVLATQQKVYFEENTPFKTVVFTGDLQVDNWGKQKWYHEFNENAIIVATCQIVLDVIRHGFLKLSNINVIVFDECHNAQKGHPICQLMNHFANVPVSEQPRVIGLTGMLLMRDSVHTILDDLENFEKTMRSTIATVDTMEDFEQVLRFSTNPDEIILTYRQMTSSEKMTYIELLVQHVLDEINLLDIPTDGKRLTDGKSADKIIKKDLTNLWKDFLFQAKDFGLYGASLAILGLIVELDLKKRSGLSSKKVLLCRSSIKHAELIRRLLVKFMGHPGDLPFHEFVMKNSSDKLNTLFGCLDSALTRFSGQKLNCLIFVDRRFTAKCLFHILKNYPEGKVNFPIRADFMVGSDTYSSPELEINLQEKWDRQVIKKFKRNDVNLIVATTVLEEGIDLQSCNLVINYDCPKRFASYVQRKGRARHNTSLYVIMVEETEKDKIMGKVQTYKLMDKKLKDLLIGKYVNRELPSVAEMDRDALKNERIFVTPSGAKLELASAVALLNRYCSTLPADYFATPAPELTIVRENNGVRAFMQMPPQSTLKQSVCGDIQPNIKEAKRSAAFETCIKLYQSGELGENLLPIDKTTHMKNMEKVYFNHWSNFKKDSKGRDDGTKKMKRYYDMIYPEQLIKCQPLVGVECFLYIITTTAHLNEKPDHVFDENIAVFNQLYQNDECNFGILTSKRLSITAPMTFFVTDGKVSVKIDDQPTTSMYLSEDDLRKLRNFHVIIFRDILRTLKDFITMDFTNKKNSVLIVPTKRGKIDMELVNDQQNWPEMWEKTEADRISMRYNNPQEYLHQVINPWYRNDKRQMYVVTKIHTNLSPLSPFPNQNQASTYAEYFSSKYNVNVMNISQFLFEVKGITQNLNMINPGMNEQGNKSKSRRITSEILIPELCHKYSFPASMWLKALVLPNTLHRLHYLLHADNLRMTIDQYLGVRSTNQVDVLHVDVKKFKIVENVAPKKSPFGIPADDAVYPVEETTKTTLADILDMALFAEHELPKDISRNWDTIFPIDLEYYYSFCHQGMAKLSISSSTGECSSAHPMNRSGQSQQLAICNTPFSEAFNINILKFDLHKRNVTGPQQREVLSALTAASAHDVFDMERYEVLGDAFLKFSTSLYLLQKHKTWHEGFLTSIKGQLVGNRNLYYCGAGAKIPGMINTTQFSRSDFLIPHMNVPEEVTAIIQEMNLVPNAIMRLECSNWEVMTGHLNVQNTEKVLELFSREDQAEVGKIYPMNVFLGKHLVSDKTVSDTVEALLGVYLASVGIQKSFRLLNYFNILPSDLNMDHLLINQKIEPRISPNVTMDDIDAHLIGVTDFQKRLGYQFRDRAYLLQALTHPSYPMNRATGCYQQLEFLGDAVLDIIITAYIFEHCSHMDPGKMTDLRSALVNNITLACVCVRNQFHKHILSQNNLLIEKTRDFARYQSQNNHKVTEHVLLLNEEDEILAESVDVPKVLGDVIEALLGAIFLDSDNDLSTVWRVIVHLMGQEILKFAQDVPVNAVRQLYEWHGADPVFSEPILDPNTDGTVMVTVKFVCCKKYMEAHGFGTNKLNAKRAAAKAALQQLRKFP
ncbi:endoribonuclease dcr-1 [Sergentomyia squamirostris]